MKKLEGKNVLISGGLSGIGRACAIAAAREGANIAIADLKSERTEKDMEEIIQENKAAIFIDCDVAMHDQLAMTVDRVVSTFGSLDVALNNAGIGGEANRIGDMTENAWHAVIGINLTGVFYAMKYELKQMLRQKSGVIVNMASILGKVGFGNSCHYVAAKHGVLGLTKTAAIEYGTDGIRINAICPGFIETPMLEKGGISTDADVRKIIENLHPMKHLGRAEEVAHAFIFLASDDSSFVTGTALEVDGGYLAQ